MSVKDIAEGWVNLARANLGLSDPETESFAKERSEICFKCEHISKSSFPSCNKCGCAIEAKIRSKNSFCPVLKW